MTRFRFTSYVLSALLIAWLITPAGFGADPKVRAADGASDTLVLDVALDAKTLSYSRADAWGSGVVRGDTFIVTGRIYAGGTIPDGDTTFTFPAQSDGSIGSLMSTGMYTTDAATIAQGEPLFISSTHLFSLDSGDGLMTQGLEGAVTAIRALIGGTGLYSGAVGQVTQEVLGANDTGGNNVRLTFQMVRLNPQDASAAARAKKARR